MCSATGWKQCWARMRGTNSQIATTIGVAGWAARRRAGELPDTGVGGGAAPPCLGSISLRLEEDLETPLRHLSL